MNYDDLLSMAKAAIDHGLKHDALLMLNPFLQPSEYRANGECFITIYRQGKQYGCMGNPFVAKPLYEAVTHNAFMAAFRDSRFPTMNQNLIPDIEINLSHLSLERSSWKVEDVVNFAKLIQPEHTLTLKFESFTATMLASEQSKFSALKEFVTFTRAKAQIPDDVPWSHIIATLSPTTAIRKSYKEIQCLHTV